MSLVSTVVIPSPFANLYPLYEVDPTADTLLIVPPLTTPFAPWDPPSAVTTASGAITSPSGLRIKVSSKHLTLASRVFRNKLASSPTTQSDGRIHLTLGPGFAPKAVQIVLNIIHSRGSKVPREVDLDTLAQIALFVDKFSLFDAVEVYADRWISKLEGSVPEAGQRDLVLWIYASYVFRRNEVFRTVTRTAASRSEGQLRTLGLPIREKIVRDVDAQRQKLVEKSVGVVQGVLEELTEGEGCERYSCDSFLLGELVKTLRKNKVQVWPRPERPFDGVSHAKIAEAVNSSAQFGWQKGVETDLWGNKVVNGVGAAAKVNRKRKSPVAQPITPESSPEPAARTLGGFDGHECAARKLVARFEELDAFEDGVAGLELESSLGYQLY
ncbi:hypothetical protein OQA88_7672 [Cercophora sp. LCS_1]